MLEFGLNLSSDLEIATNPMLYQNGVGLIWIESESDDVICLSKNFISNIWKIKPKYLWI